MDNAILCDECTHSDVCMYKEKYKKTLNAIKEANVPLDNKSFIKVCDIPQFEAILDCKYLHRRPNTKIRTVD